MATKHAMHDALRIAPSLQSGTLADTRTRLNGTIAKFLAKGAEDRCLRQDFLADDVTLAFAGTVYAVITSVDVQQIERVLDLPVSVLHPAR